MKAWVGAFVAAVATALLASPSAAAVEGPVDDASCKFSLQARACVPKQYCAYQYHFGDVTADQSCRVVMGAARTKPQQVHLAYAGKEAGTGMTLSWTTFTEVDDPQVWIGTSEADLAPATDAKLIVDSYYSEGTYSLYSYHATLADLKPNTKYYYKVGSASVESAQTGIETFKTARASSDEESFDVLVFGDLGVDANAEHTIKYLDNLEKPVEFAYHIGDISYADNAWLKPSELLGFFYEEAYNHWMNMLSVMMKNVPYMVTVGNHEAECHSPICFFSEFKKTQLANYSAYNSRWHMPSLESDGVKSMWYSFEHGPVHYTSISSETDYESAPENSFIATGINGHFGNQLAWLEEDLKKADANRENVPWIVVGMHRAMYTLHAVDEEGNPATDSYPLQKAFEDLFIKYKVDIVFGGHVHMYERHYPIANGKPVMEGVSEDGKVYTNPKAPVYIVSGAAGNSEGHEFLKNTTAIAWNAAYDLEHYGINSMRVSRSELEIKFLGTEVPHGVYDEFVIKKE